MQPLPPQGEAPASWSDIEVSLEPSACGTCHPDQYLQWQGSLHAGAMGPGLMGQLLDFAVEDRDGHQACLRCHAPLAEQADALVAELSGRGPGGEGLHRQGLICAACHVREHVRFGPPRRDGSAPGPEEKLPHGGWQVSEAFADVRFCGHCHQFDDDGYALNGKLLENTVVEWQASRYPAQGITCQTCHMPDRKHLWRGIHDPDMTRSGVTIDPETPRIEDGILTGGLVVRNTGTGHHFPTYLTPRVVFEGFQVDAAGEEIDETRVEWWIARAVTLDLSQETFDSRIPAGGEIQLLYERPLAEPAVALEMRLRVEPDAFYTDFYRAMRAGATGPARRELERALQASLDSHYDLHTSRHVLTR